jgi:predicted ribosomally synthesized peptide with SipW-like signal peptide
MKKRMLLSILTIGVVGALVAGAVTAYFTDTETAGVNQFQAGTIDIEFDESSTVPFTLTDMKPCDWGEYTIYIHNIGTNAGPLYLHFDVLPGVGGISSEPERAVGGNQINDIENHIAVDIKVDKVGDNEDPEVIIFPDDDIKLGWLNSKWIPLTTALTGWLENCQILAVTLSFHLQADTGNEYQGDIAKFNCDFLMTDHNSPSPEPLLLFLENKLGSGGQGNRMFEQGDGTWGYLILNDTSASTFSYQLYAYGLNPSTSYDLIYYADPYPGDNPGALIGTHSTGTGGNINGQSGNPDLNMDLPDPADGNFPTGAKIWLVLDTAYSTKIDSWQPEEFLFETVLIKYDDTDVP